MNASAPRLEHSIRDQLQPHLKADGFAGSGRTFRRLTHDLIQVVNIQNSRYGGEFAINLGIQPLAIPDNMGHAPNPKKITEPECEFRRRLSETGVDQWWQYDGTEQSMDAAVAAAAEVYCRVGRPMLASMGGADSPIYSITPSQLPSFHECLLGFGSTDCRTALVLARLRTAEGRIAEAQAFAAYGLDHLGPATLLRSELEKLCHSE